MPDSPPETALLRRAPGKALLLLLTPFGLFLLLFGYYLRANLRADGGHLVYALDDPYIHLALAESIRHGHYGIDAGEPASPSSSLLWPFLLVPFAAKSWFLWTPLLINVLAGGVLALWIGWLTATWPKWNESLDEFLRRWIAGAALVFVANLVGLTFVGMEHTLQVSLAAVAAFVITRILSAQRAPVWALFLVGLGPSVRYEAFGLVVAVALALTAQRQVRAALLLLVGSSLPLIAFSLYLHHLGLPLLPTSVLVKGGVAQQGSALQHLAAIALGALKAAVTQRDRLLLTVLFLILLDLALHQQVWRRRATLGAAALAAGFHLMIGQFNWFHRYEVYIVLFSTLVILYVLFEAPRFMRGWYALGLLACAAPYLEGTRSITAATHDIYLQQYQMHRFATEFYRGNVAVNDLGLVSFRRLPGQEVVDLIGLGSARAAQEKSKSPAWLDGFTNDSHADVAMIYREWFDQIPRDWTLLGSLCLEYPPVMLSHPCVRFYATAHADVPALRHAFQDFVVTVPQGVRVYRGDTAP